MNVHKMAVRFNHGDLVFGKVRGYPPWPARVDETLMPGLKVTPTKVPVFFFGTHEIGILAPKDVCFYSKHKKTLGNPQKRTGFNQGMYEIRHTPDLKFQRQSATDRDSSSTEDDLLPNKKSRLDDEVDQSDKNEENECLAVPKTNGVSVQSSSSTSSDTCDTNSSEETSSSDSDSSSSESLSDKSWTDDLHRRKMNVPRKSKSKSNNAASRDIKLYSECKVKRPTNLFQTKTANCVSELNNLGGAIRSPISVHDSKTPVPVEENGELKINSKDHKNFISLLKPPKDAQADGGFKIDEKNKLGSDGKLPNDNLSPKVASETGHAAKAPKTHQQRPPKHQMEVGDLMATTDARLTDKIKNKIAQKEAEKELKKKEKYERKKKEKRLLLQSEVKLRALDLKIKESLSVVKQDFVKCLDAMEKMDAMTVTPLMLKKNPDILVTLHKCCRFKKSDQVRLKADYLYNKFKSMFLVGEDETFSHVFQRDTQCLKGIADRLGRDVADMTEDLIPAEAAVSTAAKPKSTPATNEFPEA